MADNPDSSSSLFLDVPSDGYMHASHVTATSTPSVVEAGATDFAFHTQSSALNLEYAEGVGSMHASADRRHRMRIETSLSPIVGSPQPVSSPIQSPPPSASCSLYYPCCDMKTDASIVHETCSHSAP